MAYGLTVKNNGGVTTIDETSKQVEIVKSGTLVPGSISTVRSAGIPNAPAVVCPTSKGTSLLFIRPKRATTYDPNYPLATSIQWADANYQISPVSNVPVGVSTFNVTVSITTPQFYGNSSYVGITASQPPITNPNVDLIGRVISDWLGTYVGSGYYPQSGSITNVAYVSSNVWQITLFSPVTTQIPSTEVAEIPVDVAIFTTVYDFAFPTGWSLEYKFGILSTTSEESGDWGLEIYRSNGQLAFSSNRQNLQVENVVSGKTDLQGGTQIGQPAAGLPIIYTEVQDTLNWERYFALVTGSGYSGCFCDGTVSPEGRVRTWGVGYVFSVPGMGAYDNTSYTNNPSGTGSASTRFKTHSSAMGIAMIPMALTRSDFSPVITGGARVNDTWAVDATRTLIVGKLI